MCIKRWTDPQAKVANFQFKGSWKRTALREKPTTTIPPLKRLHVEGNSLSLSFFPDSRSTIVNDTIANYYYNYHLWGYYYCWLGFYCPRLYRKWYRSNVPIEQFATTLNHIDRIHNPTLEEFIEKYENTNKPVIITGILEEWRARAHWNKENLLKDYGQTLFKTNGTDERGKTFKMTLLDYFQYMQYNHDEKPIYLVYLYLYPSIPPFLFIPLLVDHCNDSY